MTFIHALQPKVHLQSFDNISEFKIPNKCRLAFLSEMSQRCFFEASRVSWRLKELYLDFQFGKFVRNIKKSFKRQQDHRSLKKIIHLTKFTIPIKKNTDHLQAQKLTQFVIIKEHF